MKSGVVYAGNRARGLSLDPATYIPELTRKVSMEEFAENARIAHEEAERIGAGFILVHVDYPSLPEDHVTLELKKSAREAGAELPEDWEIWEGRELTAELSAELGAPAVYMRPLFARRLSEIQAGELDPERARELRERPGEQLEAEPWRYLMIDNGHPNKWGHEILAAELAGKIKSMPVCGGPAGKSGP